MNLLPFSMPQSSRIQFVSQQAKDIWEPKIQRAISCSKALEKLTLQHRLDCPDCCHEFFRSSVSAGYIDPIWQQAERTSIVKFVKNHRSQFTRLRKETPWETSSMLRYIGIRFLPYVACALDCEHALKVAKELSALAEDAGLEGFEDLKQLLQLPVEWNASHGIAYVTTPVFKIEANSVPCDSPYIVQKEGTFFPSEGAKGLKFPFL